MQYSTDIPNDLHANAAVVDYNSWIESPKGRKLAAKLDKDVVLAEGMCFRTSPDPSCALTPESYRLQAVRYRTHVHGADGRLAREQGRRDRAGRHRWRQYSCQSRCPQIRFVAAMSLYYWKTKRLPDPKHRYQLPMLCLRKSSRDRRLRKDGQARRVRGLGSAQLCGMAHRHRREGRKRIVPRANRLHLLFQDGSYRFRAPATVPATFFHRGF